ncbi:MAG: UDP-2,3-diacylglucosamine diphosphatase LpxI [Robiginitomaculum sp.]
MILEGGLLEGVEKIAVLAGGGALPHAVIQGAKHQDIPVFVAALSGFSNPEDFSVSGRSFGLAEFGGLIKVLKKEKCSHIVMAGNVSRPNFKSMKPDLQGLKILPGAIKAAKQGDDALLKYLVGAIESEGFFVLAPQDICVASLIGEGYLGQVKAKTAHQDDIDKAMDIARLIGGVDIGQGAVVCSGLVLAVEAQEGTDKMLERVARLDASIRGNQDTRCGVLAKCLKPEQEARVDLPTVGPKTIELVSRAGLAGIVLRAGQAFIMEKETCVSLVDKHGVFLLGLKDDEE